MKYTFIINPQSRSGRGSVIWNLLKPELKKKRIDHEVFYTEYEGHATEIAAQVTADDEERTIVVLGGDGSVNEVINGIRDCSKVIFGYIPNGSGNDFTRELKLPSDPVKALENVLNPERIVWMDVGTSQCGNREHRFAVSAGIGFDASVCHHAEKSRIKSFLNKIKLGNLTYLGVALKCLFANPLCKANVVLDNEAPKMFKKVYFVAVMNHPYEGGGFRFCPQAKTDDRILDVIVVSGLPRLKVLFLLPTAFNGNHVRFKGIDIYQCKSVSIEMEQEMPIHTDGQPIAAGRTLAASLLPEQIRVIVPGKS